MLRMLHGNLFDVKCFDEKCNYIEPNNLRDPLCPALAPASEEYAVDKTLPLLDPKKPTPKISFRLFIFLASLFYWPFAAVER